MESKELNGTYFVELKLKNIRSFGKEAVLKLNDNNRWAKWNIILGDNGLGKTTLLMALLGNEIDKKKEFLNLTKPSFKKEDGFCISTKEYEGEDGSQKIMSAKFILEETSSTSKFKGRLPKLPLLCYSANRLMSKSKLNEYVDNGGNFLIDEDAKLINAEEWLTQIDYAASKESEVKEIAVAKRNQIIEILISILPDISEVKISTPTKEQLIPIVQFLTPFGWKTLDQLSLGYKTMVAWIVDVAARMFNFYDESLTPLAEPIIILVDEIDLHLHPKWQRKIFDFLTENFPNAQFIVTAHSPLVVQSAPKDANLILLKRAVDEDGNNYVEIDNDIESVRNWRLDQIMTSDLFDFESARGPEAERKILRRIELIQRDTLRPEEKSELEILNRFVHSLPVEGSQRDIEAMEILRKAAAIVSNKSDSEQ